MCELMSTELGTGSAQALTSIEHPPSRPSITLVYKTEPGDLRVNSGRSIIMIARARWTVISSLGRHHPTYLADISTSAALILNVEC